MSEKNCKCMCYKIVSKDKISRKKEICDLFKKETRLFVPFYQYLKKKEYDNDEVGMIYGCKVILSE